MKSLVAITPMVILLPIKPFQPHKIHSNFYLQSEKKMYSEDNVQIGNNKFKLKCPSVAHIFPILFLNVLINVY